LEDSKSRFSATASDYARHRPSYPEELVSFVLEESGQPKRIADVGCGTGITTRLFAARGPMVFGVDPNLDMLLEGASHGGAFLRGEAASLPLRSGSADLVTCGQAFHWFAHEEALKEFRRVLAPRGSCALFWNVRGSDAFMDAYEDLLNRASTEYPLVPKPERALAVARDSALVRDFRERTFSYTQPMDREEFHGRVASSSYVAHGVADREGFFRELDRIFDLHEASGRVAFRYATLAGIFRFA
jgi:SAM-dependent methyltransferase